MSEPSDEDILRANEWDGPPLVGNPGPCPMKLCNVEEHAHLDAALVERTREFDKAWEVADDYKRRAEAAAAQVAELRADLLECEGANERLAGERVALREALKFIAGGHTISGYKGPHPDPVVALAQEVIHAAQVRAREALAMPPTPSPPPDAASAEDAR